MVIGYFITKFYSDFLFSGVLQGGNSNTVFDEYMNENFGFFILLMILFIVVGLVAGLISYSYTAIYLKLYIANHGKNFDTQQIVMAYKQNIGKLFIFLFCGILFMEKKKNKRGIWDSLGYAWTLMTKKFWAAVGSVGLFYLMAYVVQNIITLIPYLFFMGSLFTTTQEANPNPEEIGASFVIMMLVVFFISFIVGTILNNITQLNQGIVFYSLKEDNENINTKSVIDQIGTSE